MSAKMVAFLSRGDELIDGLNYNLVELYVYVVRKLLPLLTSMTSSEITGELRFFVFLTKSIRRSLVCLAQTQVAAALWVSYFKWGWNGSAYYVGP